MKKFLVFLTLALLCFALVSCGTATFLGPDQTDESDVLNDDDPNPSGMVLPHIRTDETKGGGEPPDHP